MAGALLTGLTACGVTPPPPQVAVTVAPQWHGEAARAAAARSQTPADQSQQVTGLERQILLDWWGQLGDPVLLRLQRAAVMASVDVATARTRVAEARAGRVAAHAARLPQLNAQIIGQRDNTSMVGQGGSGAPPVTVWQAALQPQWEVDLWGGLASAARAAGEREAAAQAQLEAAHVAVVAEVANAHFAARACRQQLQVLQADAASRAETARLTDLSAGAGFTAPADAALARAASSDAASRLRETQVQCEGARRALAVLTGMDMAGIDVLLASPSEEPAWPAVAAQAVPRVPAQLLLQRADVFAAERAVAAASGDVGEAQARRKPGVSLRGSIGMSRIQTLGFTEDMGTWSLGPLSISIPLFDGGTRRAQEALSRAKYDEAVVRLRAVTLQAVREVEDALAQLAGSQSRVDLQRAAVADFERHLRATEARHAHGMASLFELEDSRRSWLSSQLALVNAQHDQMQAWGALYRALGGGWAPVEVPGMDGAPKGQAIHPAAAAVASGAGAEEVLPESNAHAGAVR